MDILATFKAKVQELGDVAVGEALGIPKQFIKGYVEEKKTFGIKTCQKIVDLWPATVVAAEMPNPLAGDGAISNVWDEDGIMNGSYCPPEWGQKKKAWNGRDVCLCLPVYNDVPQAHYFSMLATVAKYRQGLRIEFRGEDSMITRSRNHLAKRFLRDTDATWSVWFDSDMVFPRGDAKGYSTMINSRNRIPEKFLAMQTIERLISHQGRTVVGGCYWDRRGSGKLIAGGGGALMKPIPSDALHAIGFVGTGCLAIHRQVFLDIAAKFPETYSDKSIGNECGFFTNIQTPERMLGEDESFAKRATDAGHPSFLDLAVICGHIGSGNVHALPEGGSRI